MTPFDDEPPGGRTVGRRALLLAKLRNYLLAGIIVAAPISITFYIVWQVVDYFDTRVAGLIPDRYNPERFLPFSLPGIGLLLTVAVLMLIGWFTASYLGRAIMSSSELVLDRMPIVRSLYGMLKQLFQTVLAQSSRSFREVVLVEWPRPGIWSVAFVTGPAPDVVSRAVDDELVSLFMPCSPNPTTGYFLMVSRRELIVLDMSVEAAMKLIVSGGLVAPPAEAIADAPTHGRMMEPTP